MDAVEFLKKFDRMCAANASLSCSKCNASEYCIFGHGKAINPEMLVEIVEEWAKEHPVKTRQSELLKLFPNANKYGNGEDIAICPIHLDTKFECPDLDCKVCKKQY